RQAVGLSDAARGTELPQRSRGVSPPDEPAARQRVPPRPSGPRVARWGLGAVLAGADAQCRETGASAASVASSSSASVSRGLPPVAAVAPFAGVPTEGAGAEAAGPRSGETADTGGCIDGRNGTPSPDCGASIGSAWTAAPITGPSAAACGSDVCCLPALIAGCPALPAADCAAGWTSPGGWASGSP